MEGIFQYKFIKVYFSPLSPYLFFSVYLAFSLFSLPLTRSQFIFTVTLSLSFSWIGKRAKDQLSEFVFNFFTGIALAAFASLRLDSFWPPFSGYCSLSIFDIPCFLYVSQYLFIPLCLLLSLSIYLYPSIAICLYFPLTLSYILTNWLSCFFTEGIFDFFRTFLLTNSRNLHNAPKFDFLVNVV